MGERVRHDTAGKSNKETQYCKRWNGSFLSAVVDQRENDKKVWG